MSIGGRRRLGEVMPKNWDRAAVALGLPPEFMRWRAGEWRACQRAERDCRSCNQDIRAGTMDRVHAHCTRLLKQLAPARGDASLTPRLRCGHVTGAYPVPPSVADADLCQRARPRRSRRHRPRSSQRTPTSHHRRLPVERPAARLDHCRPAPRHPGHQLPTCTAIAVGRPHDHDPTRRKHCQLTRHAVACRLAGIPQAAVGQGSGRWHGRANPCHRPIASVSPNLS